MSIKNISFSSVTINPDFEALKAQLGAIYGVTSMDIDPKKLNLVSVDYDDSYTSEQKIEECLNDIGYQLCQ